MRARTRNAMGSGTLLAPRAAAASRGTSRRLYLGNATAAVAATAPARLHCLAGAPSFSLGRTVCVY